MDLSSSRQTLLLLPLLLSCCLVGIADAQHNPIKDFCRRWGHQSAVVDGKLYIDGGLVNYKPFSSSSQNLSNSFFLYNDLETEVEGMPPLYANLSKNQTIPTVSGGILWEDSVNKRLYLYGGEYYNAPPAAFNLYSYDILNDDWASFGPPTGAGTINAVSYGAGVSIPERGEAYYYGGWLSNASVPDWTGPPRGTNRLLKYEMDANTWSNLTGPDDILRAEGEMVFIPIGDAGMLVYFGGTKDLHKNGTLTPQPLDEIFLYDVSNGKWYTQKTSGRTPEDRRRFCGGATWAEDQSSYNIYIYGGAGFPPETAGFDDIYILSIPSFQWIRGPYPPNSNVTGAFPKSMMSCNVVNNAQMLVIGGTYSNDSTYMCDADAVWGTHNMNLGKQNAEDAIWAAYQPNLTTYLVPVDILTAVGGRNTGGATQTKPSTGFDEADMSVLMTRTAAPASRTPTRDVGGTTTTAPPASSSSAPHNHLSGGKIAGIVVGSVAGFLLLLLGAYFLWRKYRKPRQDAAAAPPVTEPSMTYVPDPGTGQGQMQGGWDGTQVSSPTGTVPSMTATAVSYGAQQSTWASTTPVELAAEAEQGYGYRGLSMTSELDQSPGQNSDVIYQMPSPLEQDANMQKFGDVGTMPHGT